MFIKANPEIGSIGKADTFRAYCRESALLRFDLVRFHATGKYTKHADFFSVLSGSSFRGGVLLLSI